MTTAPEQFQAWLDAPEGSQIEFKSATGGFHFEKLLDYCVALANEGGGKIILGVSDRRPRDVVGTAAFAEPGRTEAGLHQRLAHRIPVNERLQGFSTHDFLALDAICRDTPLTDAMRARIPGLIEAGAVESMGRGRGVRYHLSRAFYASLGRKGAYTRRRGLDHETNKALLLHHLRDAGNEGAPMAELLQVLPSLSRAHVKRLVQELARDGKVLLKGVTKSARWFIAGTGDIGS